MSFKTLLLNVFKKNPHKVEKGTRHLFDKKDSRYHEETPWNIYMPGAKKGVFVKRFWWIHTILKYKIALPGLCPCFLSSNIDFNSSVVMKGFPPD